MVAGLPALDNTMGALFIGVILSMALWGAGSVQMYYYFNRYPNDDYRIKLLVVFVWVMDTAHQGMVTHSSYVYLITNYANPVFLLSIPKSLLLMVLFSGIICASVQAFLIVRVYILSHRNVFITGLLIVLALGEFGVTLAYFSKGAGFTSLAEVPRIVNLSRSINILSAATDVAIALALIYLLQRSRTGFSRSDTIINRLIVFSINTGLLTSLCAIMSLITITTLPNTYVYMAFFIMNSRLYMNTLLATLNARKSVRGGLPDDTDNNNGTSSMSMNRMRPRAVEFEPQTLNNKSNHHTLSIKVDTETTRDDGTKLGRTPSESDTEIAYDQKAALPP